MPKQKKTWKDASGAIHKQKVCTKFRIGTRKSGKSALLMSDEELLAVLDDKNKKRYHAKALTVLGKRGVYVESKVASKVESLEDLADSMKHN